MRGVAGDEDAPAAIARGHQQVVLPVAFVQHLDIDLEPDHPPQARFGVLAGFPVLKINHEMPQVVLDHKRAFGEVVVAPASHGDPFEQLLRAKKHLVNPAQAAASLQLDAQLFAHGAGAAVAADQPAGTHVRPCAVFPRCHDGDAARVLRN